MINRVLIRIKVIQLLYSYLLTRSEFNIETLPDNPSRDRKFAQNIYFDLLLLLLKLSGYNIKSNATINSSYNTSLNINFVAKALSDNDDIKTLVSRGSKNISKVDSILGILETKIKTSTIYKDFKKTKSASIEEEITFWKVVFKTIIVKDESFISLLRQNDDFTLKGYELGVDLFINSLSSLNDTKSSLINATKSLNTALNKSKELYFSIFKLMIELTKVHYEFIDAAKNKFLPTYEDLNPNTRLIDNKLISSIIENDNFLDQISKSPINWNNEPIFTRKLLDKILSSEIYIKYINDTNNDYVSDCDFWKNALKNIIFNDDEFLEILENNSPYWNDDLHIIGTFVLKTIKQFANQQGLNVYPIPQFKDNEDAEFGPKLFTETINNFDLYHSYIDNFISKQWDSERLAFMDIVIMVTTIAELLKFPLIPIPVTLNEYIEIANYYSTPKSGQFINGILYSVINFLKSEGKLNK